MFTPPVRTSETFVDRCAHLAHYYEKLRLVDKVVGALPII